jgi:hypothetical protein
VEPTVKFGGTSGFTSILYNVMVGELVVEVVGVDVDEHAAIPRVETTIKPMIRQKLINDAYFPFIISSPDYFYYPLY